MEKLKNLPSLRFPEFAGNWDNRKIKEILTIGSGKDYKQLDLGDVPVFGTGGLMTMVNSYLYDGETVCIGRKGTIDKPMYFNGKIWTVDTLFYTHSFRESNPKFVFNLFQRVNWKQHNEAGGVPSLSKSTIEQISLNLPSLKEQTKIATFLTAVDDKLQALRQKKTLLEQYKKGVMQKIFSQELRFKDENGKEYPDWEEKKLGEIGEIVTGKTPSTKNLDLWDGEIQFVTPTDIKQLKYQLSTERTIKKTEKLKILPPNSIMFTCIASIGKMSISIFPSVTNQQINTLIPHESYYYEFIYYGLLNITDFIKSTPSSSTLPLINKTEFSRFIIKIPCIEEQNKIANLLSAIDEKINHCQGQIEKTEVWKKGLLQKMFC